MYKKRLSIVMAVCISLSAMLNSGIGAEASESTSNSISNNIQTKYYVSPSGSDTNDGSSDHPFATLQAARDAVRLINSNMTGDIVVNISAGNYYVNQPISFDERDSGTNGHNIIYTNKDGLGTAKFIGGNKVTSTWSPVTPSGTDADLPVNAVGNVYKTFVGTNMNFNTLYVNDTRATMARTKNLEVDPRFPASSTAYMRSAGGGISTLIYKSGDIDSESLTGLVNAQSRGDLDAQVYMWDGGYWDWMTDTIPIASINTSTRTLTYKTDPNNRAAYRPKYQTGSDARYFLQGNLGFLDQPGEYYFNKKTGYLYYYPLAGSGNISDQDIVIPAVEKIIDIKGASRTSMVSHITFSGLEFKDTNFPDYYSYGWNWGDAGVGLGYYPPEAAGSTQPSYSEQSERVEFQVGVITLTNTNNITITKTHIKNAGMFGIELYLANQYTDINNSLIEYTGHGGINLEGGYPGVGGDANGDGYNSNNKVTNTIIHDIGQLVGQTSGVTINNSGYNTFSHLEIYNTPRRGIFITAGYSRNGGTPYPNGDANFNIMKDMYSHHNTFEYIYLHDSQQDGGDDGAFFACYLYRGSTNYKPNYINQMLIDRVGANPSMRDIAPNGMNLDMGASGFEISNLKIVNPQHFNAEVETTSHNGDKIKFTNTNIDFGTHTNQLDSFNDSLMDYANIGVGTDFPSVYKPIRNTFQEPGDMYFKDDFENGLDLSKWVYRGVKPRITTEWMSEGILNGKKALKIDSGSADTGLKPVLYRDFDRTLNKVVTVNLFDRQSGNQASYSSGVSIPTTVKSLARVDNGVHAVGLGLDTKLSNDYYVMLDGSSEIVTSVPRTYGWHELKWDYTSGTDVKLYMDGKLVQTLSSTANFNRVELGADDGLGVSYYDQLYIYGGTASSPPSTLPIPPENLAQRATITASSSPVNDHRYDPQNVADDIIGVWGSGEWASNGEANPWIQLDWSSSQTINKILLYDRPNTSDWSQGGTLTFSDGSSVTVTGIPNDGKVKEVSFADKQVTWVRFQVTGSTGNNGLSEFQVFKEAASLTVPTGLTATAASGSQINVVWNAVPGATGYDLEVDGGIINNVTSPYTHTGLNGSSNHNYRVRAKDATGITLWSAPVSADTPAQTLGKFEAENYVAMNGIQTESSSEGGQNVGYIDAGDWMEYKVNVPADGTYSVKYRVAVNGSNTGQVQFVVNGVNKRTTSFPGTGGWQIWTTVSDTVTLAAGTQTVRLQVSKGGWNFNWFELGTIEQTPTVISVSTPTAITGVANGSAKTAAGLGLPGTVSLVTSTGNVNANVAWNVDAANYDPSKSKEQTFTVNGTVTLPAGVANPNNVALTTSVSVTVAAQAMPQSTLTGAQQVNAGQTFNLSMGLTGVTQSVYQQAYAQDLVLNYDPSKLQFDSVTSLKDGFQIIDTKEAVPGHIRIVVASVSGNQGVSAQGELLTFKFTAKSATQATSTTISVGNVIIANGEGNELQVGGSSSELQISVAVDKSLLNSSIASAQAKYNAAVEGNGDGLYVNGSKAQLQLAIDAANAVANNSNATQQQVDSAKVAMETAVQVFDSKRISANVNGQGGVTIGDLAIVAGAYGKQSGQAGWNAIADVNKDGKIDIEDLAIVAKAILQ
ncbi:DUF7402 domain-containing protein [Paenibacillus aceris]|uniref:Probable pectate lyase C n=1 Tax=Paenibacillus aceris TaxID=869555 RepID=A0ABS4I3H4_9BACL|nr:carbohydrate-binding protein [Paenibacillus aceris]MBP1965355.1 hypothetical protein [Paenibacillus aceris]NHW36038.1 carbohydrate-binding protein [Paenibacillus aceris]